MIRSLLVLSLWMFLSGLLPSTAIAQDAVSKEIYARTLKTHNDYFQLRELGKYDAAYDLFTEGQKRSVTLAKFSGQWAAAHKKFGRLTRLENTKVTWYRNPEGLPSGLYAAIDFRASFERLPIYCGFLVWSIDEGYKIQREDFSFLETEVGGAMSDADKDKAYHQLSCR